MVGVSFLKEVQQWLDKVEDRCDETMRQTAKEVSQRVVDRTGVSSGRLLGSWTPSIGTPATHTYEGGPSAWIKTGEGWAKDEGVAAANKAKAKAHVEPMIRAVTESLEFSNTYYLSNNTPYAEQAENQGWSRVGPYMMMATTAAEFDLIVALGVQVAKKRYS